MKMLEILSMTRKSSVAGIVLGLALLVSSGFRAYSTPLDGSDLTAWLRFIQIASQSLTGAALIFYFSLGGFKPIKFEKADTLSWDASHSRPSFTSFAANPVLSKFGRVTTRPPRT